MSRERLDKEVAFIQYRLGSAWACSGVVRFDLLMWVGLGMFRGGQVQSVMGWRKLNW